MLHEELQAVRKELYFVMGNCFVGAFGYALEGRQEEARAARDGIFLLVQFGARAKLLTAAEGNELLECIKNDGLGYHLLFWKHGHADESADALVAVSVGGTK